jgi:hypothetical protein
MYLEAMGSWKYNQAVRRHTREHPGEKVPLQLEVEVVDSERNSFFGWVLSSINNMGHKGKTQLFYLSFTARFHGLSIMGQSILASHGFMMKVTMYNKTRAKLLEEYEEDMRYRHSTHIFEIMLKIVHWWGWLRGAKSGWGVGRGGLGGGT